MECAEAVARLENGLVWPLPGFTRITSSFGMRRHPLLKRRLQHTGIDITARRGAPVVAAAEGVAIFSGIKGRYGKTVIIAHEENINTLYAHLDRIVLRSGERVKAKDIIGYVGSTGLSTGPHLHFELRYRGIPVDPRPLLTPNCTNGV